MERNEQRHGPGAHDEHEAHRSRGGRGARLVSLMVALVLAAVGMATVTPTTASAVAATGPEGCVEVPDGIQGWWSFDGFFGDVTGTQPGSTTVGLKPVRTAPDQGRVFGAAEFDDGGVVVDPVDLHLDQEVTVDFWMKSAPNDRVLETIVDHRVSAAPPNTGGFAVFTYNGQLGLQLADGTEHTNIIPDVSPVETGEWVFVAITVTAEDGNARFYIDGALAATVDVTSLNGPLSVPQPLMIGQRMDSAARYKGTLDEVEIFNRALGDNELVEIAERGKCRLPAECWGERVTVNLNWLETPTSGNDVILGTSGPDVIDALDGDDLVCASGGDDVVKGRKGDDIIFGGSGNDRLVGSADFDRLSGNRGNDSLSGGGGKDWLSGNAGNDILIGGPGPDRLAGNPGRDRCDGSRDRDQDRLPDGSGPFGTIGSSCESFTNIP